MISREEAETKAQIIDFQGGYTIELVSNIYDSIGSCGECKSFTPYSDTELHYHMLPEGYGSCHLRKRLKPTAYCDEFERKK